MHAISCIEPGRIGIVEVPAPPTPAGWARVAIAYVGICGTDYHIYEGTHPFLSYPRIIGHELSGRIIEPGTSGLQPGEAVVINPYLNCGTCVACRGGTPNCCENIKVLGVHIDGGMTAEIVVPSDHVYPARNISLRDAAMVEFLAIGAHAVRRSGVDTGRRALVIGAGPIGLGTAIFSRIAGFETTVLDVAPEKVQAARDLGFFAVAPTDIQSNDFAQRHQTGFDVVLDATGSLRSMSNAIGFVRNGGALTLVGVTSGDLVWPDAEVHRRELTIRASRNATRSDFALVLDSMQQHVVPTERLATHATDLHGVPDLLPVWAKDRGCLIKAVVQVA